MHSGKYKVVYEMTNRGAHCIPTEFFFLVVLLAVQYYNAICANEEVMQKLMSSSNQRNIFLKAMPLTTSLSGSLKNIL